MVPPSMSFPRSVLASMRSPDRVPNLMSLAFRLPMTPLSAVMVPAASTAAVRDLAAMRSDPMNPEVMTPASRPCT